MRPGPRGGDLVRHLLAFRRDPAEALRDQAQRYGDASEISIAGKRFVLLSHPDLVRSLLLTEDSRFSKGAILKASRRLFGEGLLTSEGEHHHRQRRALQPAFHRGRLESYVAVMAEEASRMTESWRDGEERDTGRDMTALTLAIVGRTLFGSDVAGDAEEIAAILRWGQRSGSIARVYLSDFVRPVLPRLARRLQAPLDRLEAIVQRHVTRHREQGDTGDLLSLLLAARAPEAGSPTMTDAEVRDESVTMFVAGHETTSSLLSWTFHAIGRHPEVEARLLAEVDTVLGDRRAESADLPRLPFLHKVLLEVLRLWPPAWIVGRQALEDCALGPNGEQKVGKGTAVFASQWVIHRDPRFFRDPLTFDPDRWTDAMRASLPRFAFFPFGGGARNCIGEHFALAEAAAVVSVVVRRFRLRPLGPEPGRGYRMLLHPRPGLPIRLEKRRMLYSTPPAMTATS
jgi:cytochrome P450